MEAERKELPKGWIEVFFTDVFDINGGTQPPKSQFIDEPKEGYIRLLQIRDFGKKPVPTYIPNNGKLRTCKLDDILIARYGASIGRIVTGQEGAYNVALAKVNIPDLINKNYVKGLLKSHIFQNVITSFQRTAQSGFNKDDLSTIKIPLPPLPEQERIVVKLEALFGSLEQLNAGLDKIPTLLKNFKQAVLTQAVTGKLTEEWRVGKELDVWEEKKLIDVCSEFKYGSSSKSLIEGDVPVLRMGNLQGGKVDFTNLKYSVDKVEIEKYKLEKGDVLFNRTNSPELVGKTAVYEDTRDSIYAGYIIKIKCGELLNPYFLNGFLNSPMGKQWCSKVKSDGVSQSNINAQKLKSLEINIPSIQEQTEIVNRVESLFARAEALEARYQVLKEKVAQLPQAILAKAFKGELVEQLESDGDAKELLKEILELKAATATASRASASAKKKKASSASASVSKKANHQAKPVTESLNKVAENSTEYKKK